MIPQYGQISDKIYDYIDIRFTPVLVSTESGLIYLDQKNEC